MAFHLTSRLFDKERLFSEQVRDDIVDLISDTLSLCDTTLIAFTVMPNHLHLVVRQNDDPVWRLMQSLMRKVSYRVQRECGLRGHMVERRYSDRACRTPGYLREAIVYTHLNPVKSRICAAAAEYRWSSCSLYSSGLFPPLSNEKVRGIVTPLLGLFGRNDAGSIEDCKAGYDAYEAYRQACRVARRNGTGRPDRPAYRIGNIWWRTNMADAPSGDRKRRDLRDIARQVLEEQAEPMFLSDIQGRRFDKRAQRVRRELILRARDAGHSGVAIARFLCIGESSVSRIAARAYRKGTIVHG